MEPNPVDAARLDRKILQIIVRNTKIAYNDLKQGFSFKLVLQRVGWFLLCIWYPGLLTSIVFAGIKLSYPFQNSPCQPDGTFHMPDFDSNSPGFDSWRFSNFFNISLVVFRSLTFGQAKFLDVCWDIVSLPTVVIS
jgi:hypothetical protein